VEKVALSRLVVEAPREESMKAAEFVVASLIGIAAGLIAGYLMFSMAWKYVSVSMWFQSNKVWSGDWMI
jgi:hypothetical protein